MAERTAAYGDERVLARVWRKILPPDGPDECWLWAGGRNDAGYGIVTVDKQTMRAHRYVYAALVGEIPNGLVLDHTCHTNDPTCYDSDACTHRLCVRPDHLEPVTSRENARRVRHYNRSKTNCSKGHPYDAENTRWYRGMRYCIACRKLADQDISRRYQERHREEINARARAYREANKDARRQRSRDWYAKNKDYVSERHKAWRAKDPERARSRVEEWRARKRREQQEQQPGLW